MATHRLHRGRRSASPAIWRIEADEDHYQPRVADERLGAGGLATWRAPWIYTPREKRRMNMIFITTYKVKPYISNDETKKVLEVFAQQGEGPGTIAHYVATDGSHGVVISEADDLEPAYANLQNYTQWVEYDTTPVLKVDRAVPHIMAALS
jgi:hypothetical protein